MNVFDKIKNEEGDQNLLFKKENNLKNTKIDLSDLEILTKLGRGGFGSVSKVKCKVNNNIYALKIIEKNQYEKYNYREIEMFKILNHPNIIKYYDNFEDDNKIYLLIEYMENGSLTRFIGSKSRKKYNAKIPNELVWNLFLQSISGLVYIHSQNIIHRDIKPDNLLIDNNMKIKISDFGISKIIENNLNNTNTTLGVQNQYAAPESHTKYYNEKVDIYSLGKTFQEFYNIIENPDDKEFDNLIKSMMKNKPNERPSSKEVYEQVITIYNKKYLKNTCTCMDSLIRCFYSLSPMTSHFLKLNDANNDKNIIKNDFINCLKAFTDKDLNKWFIAVEHLRHSLEKQNPCLESNKEIEPFILFSFLFKELNNELNKSIIDKETQNRYTHIINNELVSKINQGETKLNFINNFLLKQNSYISNNFMGLIKEIRHCKTCQLKTYKFKSYFSITFDLLKMPVNNKTNKINLEECFAYEKQEQLSKDLMCCNCVKINSHFINKYYYSSPILLIINIKNDSLNNVSLYLNEIIDLNDHFEFKGLPTLFNLKGILKNKKEKYISNINIDNSWYLCEGKKIKKIEFKSTKEKNENIIMLFYQSIK